MGEWTTRIKSTNRLVRVNKVVGIDLIAPLCGDKLITDAGSLTRTDIGIKERTPIDGSMSMGRGQGVIIKGSGTVNTHHS